MRPSSLPAFALALGFVGQAQAAVSPHAAEAQARDTIWGMEQEIYAGRSRGDVKPYLAATAEAYVSWPPGSPAPLHRGRLVPDLSRKVSNHERLTMTLVDFTQSGTVAVIYYRTHRTTRADGTAADDHFDVTHTWVREAADWKLIGGMARNTVPAPP